MVARLTEALGSDEIEQIAMDELFPELKMESEMAAMREMMSTLTQTVNQLGEQLKSLNTQHTTVDVDEGSGCNQNEYVENGSETSENEQSEIMIVINSHESEHYQPTVRRHYFSVKEIAESIPEYDPTDEMSLSAQQFINHVNEVRRTYNWEEKSLLLDIYSKLKGAARMWVNCRQTLFATWSELENALIDEFGTSYDEAEVGSKMKNAPRRHDEKYIDYCFRIHAYGTRFGLSESAIIRFAREGLKHREFQLATVATKFNNMKEVRETLNEYLLNTPTTSRQTKEFAVMKENNFGRTMVKKETIDRVKTSTDFICYNCGGKGHLSRNCLKPQKKERCANCQRTTHRTENCPEKQTNITAKRTNINNIAESSDTYNDVVRKIEDNGHSLMSFMDSGSPASLIRKKCSEKFGELLQICSKKLTGFAGGSYEVTRKRVTTVEIDGNAFETILFVVEDEDIPEDVLIGRDLICRKGNRLIIGDGECRVERSRETQVNSIAEPSQNAEIQQILIENRHCMAENLADLGKCSVEKMKISLTTDVPINMKPYRIAFAKREVVANIINELLACNIIRKSKSHYASPVVLVGKKNGEHRLCVDYRSLNKITRRIPFPMPNLEEQFSQLAGNLYFSTLDLRMGYHQIEMDENSKHLTAFVTTDGHYEYNRMPFGLVNAPGVFQRVMNTIVSELTPGEVMVYLDDVVIPSKTIAEGIQRLRNVLNVLSCYGLRLRLDKCHFLKTEIEHLGHIINKDGIRPGANKINAIKQFKIPENVTKVRRFLGLTGFFRKFVPDYALISKPLTKLLNKNEVDNFRWSTKQQNAFEKLISTLTNAPLLELYDVAKQHELHTDACSVGLAGVLLQSTSGKDWRPVMYYSRHCTPAEQKYHSYELEVLAVVESLDRFRLYLLGKKFRIVTDCSAIVQMKEQRELKPRIARWWLRMQEFDFDLTHRPGNRLSHVDALSRAPVESEKECEPAGYTYTITDQQSDWVVAMQQRDEKVKRIMDILADVVNSPDKRKIKEEYEVVNGRLYYKSGTGSKFFVPKAVRRSLVRHYHDDMGHFATEKTLQRLSKHFWFPKMRKLVKEHIKSCITCCYNKSQKAKPEGEMHYSDPIPIPFRLLHVDHLGPFIRSRKGNTHLFVLTDAFSKFCVLKAVKNTKTGPVINTLKEVTGYFGLPEKIISDRGSAFTSKLFETFCKTNNIHHVKTAVRTPRANGQVERMNATILDALKTMNNDPKRWDECLNQLQWVLNSQVNSTTRFTPNELVFNYNVKDLVHNNLVAAVTTDLSEPIDLLAEPKQTSALENINNERKKWKTRFDNAHAKPTEYKVGDLVVIRHVPAATGESRKLEPKYRGPYTIARILGNDRYVVKDVPGLQITNKPFNSVYSADHLKRWCDGYPDLVYSDQETSSDGDCSEDDQPLANLIRKGRVISRDD